MLIVGLLLVKSYLCVCVLTRVMQLITVTVHATAAVVAINQNSLRLVMCVLCWMRGTVRGRKEASRKGTGKVWQACRPRRCTRSLNGAAAFTYRPIRHTAAVSSALHPCVSDTASASEQVGTVFNADTLRVVRCALMID